MGGYHEFYEGAQYGLDKPSSGGFLGMEYRAPVSSIGVTTDARQANQLKSTSEKLNTGISTVEIQMTMNEVQEMIPNQHLEELNRLRKITGVDFTLHGPLVEPTGVSKQGWDETDRLQAERQMWTALERAHKVKPDGNLVVTFHSSNGLPEPMTTEINKEGKTEIKSMWAVDERSGQFAPIEMKKHYFPGQESDPIKELENKNKENWTKQLSQTSFHAHQGENSVRSVLSSWNERDIPKEIKNVFKDVDFSGLYNASKTPDGQKIIKSMTPESQQFLNKQFNDLNHGEIYVREAYQELRNAFDIAYEAAEKDNRKKDMTILDEYKNEIKDKVKSFEEPANISELAEEVLKGINVLNAIQPPQMMRPLKDFAIDKASDTFSSLALKSYNEFERKTGGKEKAPIISIENPPAGMGLNRAEDLRELVDASRKKFVDEAKRKWGMSESEAKKEAEKMIGVTWDVGHINMIRKHGYSKEDVIKETEKIGKYVKHVHLSDNFGMEHTELPMGMGNVPTKEHMEILDKYNKQLKKIIETGPWYQHFQVTPFVETLEAFGTPLYGGGATGPYWNQIAGMMPGKYFAGYGFNPDVHHSIYGAGFSGLPTELGGQIGSGRSRLSGTPME